MNPDLVHYGFQWKMGENVDTIPFMPSRSCERGGLYFTTKEKLINFFPNFNSYVKLLNHWLAEVTVDPDEDVWSEGDKKWKAHRVTVVSLTKIMDLDLCTRLRMFWSYPVNVRDDQLLPYTAKWHPMCLVMLEPELETDELVKLALFGDSEVLQFVANQTFSVCCYAASIDEDVVKFIRDQDMRERVEKWLVETKGEM